MKQFSITEEESGKRIDVFLTNKLQCNRSLIQKAIHDLTKAIEVDPNNALAYRYLGTTYCFNRDYIKALKNLRKAEKLVRGNELTQLYSDIGQLYISIGEHQKAETYFKESLRLQPNFIEGYRNLIWGLTGKWIRFLLKLTKLK